MKAKNPALIIRGPAVVIHKGKTTYSKANIVIKPTVTEFPIETSAFGVAETREDTAIFETSYTPAGKIADALVTMWPHRSYTPGQLVHHTKSIESIDTATNIITITAHGFDDGAGVRATSFGVLPAGLDEDTKYFVHRLSANTLTLHLTRANAIANAAIVDITSAGTDEHKLIEQEEVIIHSMADGKRVIFHNGCITKMPSLIGAGAKTALGEVGFTLYRKHGSAPGDDNSFYNEDTVAFTDNSFDPADIVTEPYELAWGDDAPWDSIGTKEGSTFEPAMSITPVLDDAGGIVSHEIESISATLTARPRNVTTSQLLSKRNLQGAGSGRGRRITGDDLVLTGSEIIVTLFAASIDDSPVNYDGKEDRIGDVKWRANRSASGGSSSALFSIAEPA